MSAGNWRRPWQGTRIIDPWCLRCPGAACLWPPRSRLRSMPPLISSCCVRLAFRSSRNWRWEPLSMVAHRSLLAMRKSLSSPVSISPRLKPFARRNSAKSTGVESAILVLVNGLKLPRERSFSSMMASLRERRSVRPCGPSACASRSLFLRYRWRPTKSLKGLREDADEVVCLEDHEFFGAIGFYYADFRQVSDKEVVDLVTRFTTLCESAGTSRSDTANSVNPLATKCLCAEGEESEGNSPGCSSPARVFTGGAEAMWREPPIDEVVVTDAVPVTSVNEAGRERLVVLQTADLFADVIRS